MKMSPDAYEVGEIASHIPFVSFGSGDKNLVVFPESSALVTPVSANPALIVKLYRSLLPSNYKVYIMGYDSELLPDYPHEKMAETYATFIKNKLGKALIAGISYGGFVAIPLAALYPDIVEKLFLIVTAHSASEDGVKLAKSWIKLGEEGNIFKLYLRFRDIISVMWMRWLLHWITLFSYRSARKVDNNITTFIHAYSYIVKSNERNKQYLSQIKAPTVIFGGTRDQFFSQAIFEETAKLIPNATVHMYPNYRHFFPMEYMKEFKAKLLPLL